MSERVIVLGGGVAGLSAAHELVKRGYEVEILERDETVGGKARSHLARASKLPAEHGFRFFARFYWHLIETMKEIRFPGPDGPECVFHHLFDTAETAYARDGRDLLHMPLVSPRDPGELLRQLVAYVRMAGADLDVSLWEMKHFFDKMIFVLFSCRARRNADLSKQSWWTFIGAEDRSEGYQTAFARSIHSLVAANPKRVNAYTIGNCAVAGLLGVGLRDTRFDGRRDMVGRSFDRILDGTSSEAWLEPWRACLESAGVRISTRTSVRRILCDRRVVTGVEVVPEGSAPHVVEGDRYVCALPVEHAAELLNGDLLAADPNLQVLREIAECAGWMVGAQFYLKRKLDYVAGHTLHANSPWALTSIHQARFWPRVDFPSLSGGQVADCLSVCISDWDAPDRHGRTAKESSRSQILDEVWAQLCDSYRGAGRPLLEAGDVVHRHLDEAVLFERGEGAPPTGNRERLLLNEVRIQHRRPGAGTAIPNFFLASDYVATHADLATMEGANEAARRAVNAILERGRRTDAPCALREVHEPEILAAPRELDRRRYEGRLPFELPLEFEAQVAQALEALSDA